jgi:transmembrane sensor
LQADYQTSTGKDQTVTLADGSIVTLGARSAIAVHYRPGTRDVTLLAGEAFFQVKHDATRPFQVTAGAIQARDIGTRFDVRLDPTEIRVGVQDGRVGVSSPTQTQEVVLNAGDEINVDRSDGHVTRKTVSPDTVGSWQTGTLVVDSDTVGHVTDTLKRYYPGFIVNWSAKLWSRQVGGIYDLHNIPAALRAAVVPSGGRVREVAGHMLIATDAPISHEQ